jgi:hypothetical protein
MTTLDKLSAAWNALRNAALGQGTVRPKGVSAELATRVGTAYEAWRRWLDSLGPVDTLYAQAFQSDNLAQWRARGDALRLEVQRATGHALPEFPAPVAQQVLQDFADVAVPIGTGVLLVASAVVAALLLRRSR